MRVDVTDTGFAGCSVEVSGLSPRLSTVSLDRHFVSAPVGEPSILYKIGAAGRRMDIGHLLVAAGVIAGQGTRAALSS